MTYARLTKRRSFALSEICVAIALLSLVLPFLISSLQKPLLKYQAFESELRAQEIADEHLSQFVAKFIAQTPTHEDLKKCTQFEEESQIGPLTVIKRYFVELSDESKKKAAKISFFITVYKNDTPIQTAERSVNLCATGGK